MHTSSGAVLASSGPGGGGGSISGGTIAGGYNSVMAIVPGGIGGDDGLMYQLGGGVLRIGSTATGVGELDLSDGAGKLFQLFGPSAIAASFAWRVPIAEPTQISLLTCTALGQLGYAVLPAVNPAIGNVMVADGGGGFADGGTTIAAIEAAAAGLATTAQANAEAARASAGAAGAIQESNGAGAFGDSGVTATTLAALAGISGGCGSATTLTINFTDGSLNPHSLIFVEGLLQAGSS